jgi:PHD/YefM family antitoxin component YafN of YafNO toxin-antitoxin module
MPCIRPISDLCDHFEEVRKEAHECCDPIFLTKDGYGDMVIMSMETWEAKQFKTEIYHKLIDTEAKSNLSKEEIFSGLPDKKKRAQPAKVTRKAPAAPKKKPEKKA